MLPFCARPRTGSLNRPDLASPGSGHSQATSGDVVSRILRSSRRKCLSIACNLPCKRTVRHKGRANRQRQDSSVAAPKSRFPPRPRGRSREFHLQIPRLPYRHNNIKKIVTTHLDRSKEQGLARTRTGDLSQLML
jgi:hypothetical protein